MTSDIPPIQEPVTSDTPPHHDPRADRAVRRAGIDSIALFVILLITLLSFGASPMVWAGDDTGGRASLNVLSCLGVVGGVYAIFFLLLRFRGILKLSAAKKTLGLIGAIGLILHAVIALAFPIQSGGGGAPPIGAAGLSGMGRTGSYEWQIDGRTYHVNSTYYLLLPEGVQYTIEYPYSFDYANRQMTDEQALVIAFPLMKYAHQSRVYEDINVTKVGQGRLSPTRVGVTLFETRNSQTRGYKIALSFDEIEQRLAQVDQGTTSPDQ